MARAAAPLSPVALAAAIETFLVAHPHACVVEEGAVLFDMRTARWAIDAGSGRCVLQFWSEERNLQRTVLSLRERRDSLRIEVRRFGQARPQVLTLAPECDQRTPAAREAMRRRFAQPLSRALQRVFPDLKQGDSHLASDLEHSFGPAYLRSSLHRGQTVWALVGVNGEESQATVDGIVAVAVLWLELCRAQAGDRKLVTGGKIVVPPGMGATVRERMHWLDRTLARWELWEFDALREELTETAPAAPGNTDVRLVAAFDPVAVKARFAAHTHTVAALLAPADRERMEVLPRSATEISFRLHGLEFARFRHGASAHSFAREDRITFGAGAHETPLQPENEPLLRDLATRLFASRRAGGNASDPLYRMQPERWLEAELRRDLAATEPCLLADPVYTQVPSLTSADRGMLDLLAVTRSGRLAVLELKVEEDMHMPFQGLDYWLRVRALHAAGAFTHGGYFPGIVLSSEPPLLYFVVPALHLHSTFDTLMRHIAPEVEWRLLAIDEKWRRRRSVIFRKSGGGHHPWPRVLAGSNAFPD